MKDGSYIRSLSVLRARPLIFQESIRDSFERSSSIVASVLIIASVASKPLETVAQNKVKAALGNIKENQI